MDEEEHRQRLAAFVIRLRRVLASSLAQDDAQLKLADEWKMIVTERGDITEFRRWLPDEQHLESVAARLRPLLLQKYPVYCHKGLESIGFLLRAARPGLYQTERKRLKHEWQRLVDGGSGRYLLQTIEPKAEQGSWHDFELTDAWLYGDLIHADRDSARPGYPNIEQRFTAAFTFVADAVSLCWRTLGMIFLVRRTLALPERAWSTYVAVEGNRWSISESPQVWTAASGTEPPPLADLEDDPRWKPFDMSPEEFERRAEASRQKE